MFEFSATKIFRFEMAHKLSCSYSEECQQTHGHSYKMEVTVMSQDLNQDGMVMDFKRLKEIVQPIVDFFDHSCVTEEDLGYNPTAENMVYRIFQDIHEKLRVIAPTIKLKRIRLWETETGFVDVEYK